METFTSGLLLTLSFIITSTVSVSAADRIGHLDDFRMMNPTSDQLGSKHVEISPGVNF